MPNSVVARRTDVLHRVSHLCLPLQPADGIQAEHCFDQRIHHGDAGLLSILITSLLWAGFLQATIGLLTAGLGLFLSI